LKHFDLKLFKGDSPIKKKKGGKIRRKNQKHTGTNIKNKPQLQQKHNNISTKPCKHPPYLASS
jgi:hypothetical protein